MVWRGTMSSILTFAFILLSSLDGIQTVNRLDAVLIQQVDSAGILSSIVVACQGHDLPLVPRDQSCQLLASHCVLLYLSVRSGRPYILSITSDTDTVH